MVRCIVLNLRLIRTPHLTATTPSIPSALPVPHRDVPKPPSDLRSVYAWTPSRFRLQGSEKKALIPPVPLPRPRFCAPAERLPFRVARACSWTTRKKPQQAQEAHNLVLFVLLVVSPPAILQKRSTGQRHAQSRSRYKSGESQSSERDTDRASRTESFPDIPGELFREPLARQ